MRFLWIEKKSSEWRKSGHCPHDFPVMEDVRLGKESEGALLMNSAC